MVKNLKLAQRRRDLPTTHLNPAEIAGFQTFWENMYQATTPPQLEQSSAISCYPPDPFEIEYRIKHLANGKAVGPDRISAEALKAAG